MHQLKQTLEGILDRLDAIHKTLESPLLTQARELCRLGMDRMQKGLLDKALEAFLESEKKNDTDCFVQFQLGTLYLYGRDEDDNVIDLPKVEEHFRLAARYANAEIGSMPEAAKFCGEAYFHAAIACYAQANEKWIAGDTDSARRFTEQALELSNQERNYWKTGFTRRQKPKEPKPKSKTYFSRQKHFSAKTPTLIISTR